MPRVLSTIEDFDYKKRKAGKGKEKSEQVQSGVGERNIPKSPPRLAEEQSEFLLAKSARVLLPLSMSLLNCWS